MNSKIAVLITCFNRRLSTIKCLDYLYSLKYNLDVFLVDDNSTDGTYEAVSLAYPKVNLIKGNGNLFWTRGMALAWEKAAVHNYDFYLWLNDDVFLNNDAIDELFACSKVLEDKAVVSGIVADQNDKIIYGGFTKKKKLIQPNGQLNPINYLNGNIVLVPKYVYDKIGGLDNYFIHDFGDVDYGFRAIKNNIPVMTTTKIVAKGQTNIFCRVRMNNVNIIKRFKKLYSPLGSNPFKQFYFLKKHQNISKAIAYFIFLHFLNIIPDSLNNLLFGKKYT
ncbi:glycosyltransferase family 2 protein [Maribacter sp. LLG6340-A2]|uniref:glycosyltransferase family 2 protein n=1 Tax=Maribacter sp. LLG6340-A2 TaxID=3160834 RepID=UPI00386C5C14